MYFHLQSTLVSCKCSSPAEEVNTRKVINANSNKNVAFSMWHFQASQPLIIALELDKYDQIPLQMEMLLLKHVMVS